MPAAPDSDTTTSTRSPNTADTVLAPKADTVQVEARPADAQAPVQPINRASFAGVRREHELVEGIRQAGAPRPMSSTGDALAP